MSTHPATRDEAQEGLNDTWPGDPVPGPPPSPRGQLISEAQRLLTAMRRVGFSSVAQRRMEQTIEWMRSEAS